MADRTVKVSLVAQANGYIAEMDRAAKKTREVGTEAQKLADKGQAFEAIGLGLASMGALAAVGVGLAVKRFADFDEAMSNVKAATQESAENMGLLRDAALDAGASTVFSAVEAANAIEELGKNGLSTAQILEGGLKGALSLASAGQLDVARAAEIAAISMKQFNLEGEQIPHIADLLAAGAGKAAGDVEDLAQALNQSALVAAQTGLTIEDTTGVLAAFADAGLLGSDAGTSLKSMLQRLTPVSKESKDAMEKLGISAYDAQGDFIGIENFAGVLEDRLKGLTTEQRNAAMAQIFGSDAVRAASVLYQQGADGIAKYVDQTNDSGFAAKVAADRLNNLNGDLEKLGGAFDTYLIKSGSGANDMLRTLVQGATGLVDAVGSLPQPVLAGGLALGGLVAVVGLVGGAALIAVPKVAAFKAALTTMGISGGTAARGIGAMSGALAGAGIAFALYADYQAKATANTQEFKDSLDPATGAITDYTRELVAKKLAEADAFTAAERVGVSQKELTEAVLEGGKAFDEIRAKIGGTNTLGGMFDGTSFSASTASAAMHDLNSNLETSRDRFADEKEAAEGSAESTDTAAEAYINAAGKVEELESNMRTLIDTINEANGVGQDAVSANATYQESLAGIAAEVQAQKAAYEEANGSLTGFSLSLDQNTASGSANAAMLSGVASDAQAAAAAQFELDKKTMSTKDATDKYIGTLGASRDALMRSAEQAGFNADEVQALTDKVYAMPSAKEIDIIANTAEATRRIEAFKRALAMPQVVVTPQMRDAGGYYANRADGGAIYGPGGPRDDVIPAMLSNGEHVLDAEDVRRMGGQSAVYRFRQGLYDGQRQRFASGGAVSYAPAAYVTAPSNVYGAGASQTTNTKTINVTVPGVNDPAVVAEFVAHRLNVGLAG